MNITLNLENDTFEQLRAELLEVIGNSGLDCRSLDITNEGDVSIKLTAELSSDPLLPEVPGQISNRRRNVLVRGVLESPDSGRAVLWCEVEYSVGREASNFLPVPLEYGARVAIRFGWEFDLPSLRPGYADVRERDSIHYVSVMPSDDILLFVRTIWGVLAEWCVLDESE